MGSAAKNERIKLSATRGWGVVERRGRRDRRGGFRRWITLARSSLRRPASGMMADLFELARPEPMARHNQPDLFGDSRSELFAGDAAPVAYHPDPDRVRRRLRRILAEARAAATVP